MQTRLRAAVYARSMEDVVDRLVGWPDPAVRYRARLVLDGADRNVAELRALADEVRESPDCIAVVEGGFVDPNHPYRKWQGAHWALVQLAERGHPGGDPRLQRLQELVFAWILAPAFLRPNWTWYMRDSPIGFAVARRWRATCSGPAWRWA